MRRRTGGPFGAAVFERRSGRLVAVGVNRVRRADAVAVLEAYAAAGTPVY